MLEFYIDWGKRMKTADRQKMCPNCDGKIPFEVVQCPYCFTAVPAESAVQSTFFKTPSASQDTLGTQYAPPYQPKQPSPGFGSDEKKIFTKVSEKAKEELAPSATFEKEGGSAKKTFWPILLLSLAGNLFTLGVLQFFFAENGKIKLEINTGYWFLFLVIAAPLFYFGNQLLNQKEEEV